jgi:circadian clock protein KaiC
MMSKAAIVNDRKNRSLPKAPTGIQGLDEITGGGLPRGRPTLVCGGAGSGKTLLATQFLVRGVTEFGEHGVFMTFEETARDLARNVRSLGIDLEKLVGQNKLVVDYVHVERSEIEETGEYDLEGLFIRLGHAIDSIGARRVVLDTIETLFGGLDNAVVLRSELRRLFRWLKDKEVTAIVTGERGDGMLTRHGLEEHVSDCVIVLDNRVTEQLSTRRLRIVKYRGSLHGTNEYPFLIDENGISVLPITSIALRHKASDERVSTGIPRLDAMLGGPGVYRGSSVLIAGTAGTGKTSLAAHIADAACRRGERCLYFSFEEAESQLIRNMRSIGLNLASWLKRNRLRFHATRPSAYGLEVHLATFHKLVSDFQPRVVIVDAITTFTNAGTSAQAESMLMRLIDFFKSQQITAVFTSLTHGGNPEQRHARVSSIIDTWLLLTDIELAGERNRCMYILKSRGMAHSNQTREFLLTDHGIELKDVYLGPQGVLTGSMRLAQEMREKSAVLNRQQEIERRQRELDRKRQALESQIVAQRAQFEVEEDELKLLVDQERTAADVVHEDREQMSRSRKADQPGEARGSRSRRTTLKGGRR